MTTQTPLRSLLSLFFVSGALGLGYQVLWSKMVLHFVGVSSWSYAIVLAAFMGGLALGGRFLARLADRVQSPLALFGWLELLVGLYAIAYPALSDALGAAYLAVATALPEQAGGLAGLGIKAALAGLLLLPPTILMGATYPAMVRHATPRLALVGRRASQLYAINALGAVLGAPAMAFLLIPTLGLHGSLTLLAIGNAVLGLAALLLARREGPLAARSEVAAEPAAPALTTPRARLLLGLLLAAGTISFACEIAWTRLFSLVLGSSTYSFAIIVGVFIAGISVGSGLLSRFESRVRDPLVTLGWSQVVAALLVLAPLPAMPLLPWLFGRVGQGLPPTMPSYWQFEATKAALCAVVMFPPALLMGLCIPLAVKAVARGLDGLAADTGRVHSANTTGNVLGALSAGLVLLPLLGTESLLRAAAGMLALIGAGALALAGPAPDRGRLARALPVTAVACVLTLALLMPAWNPAWFTLVPFRRDPMPPFGGAQATVAAREILMFEDDASANVLVMSQDGPEGRARALLVNGKPDASSHGDMPTQLLLAHVPLLAHGSARTACVIGLASGVTSGALLDHDVERLDVVDIVRAMPAASRLFDEWNGRPLDDPRTRVIIDDARAHLFTSRARYDVIISEPSNPWIAGVGGLFAREHFDRATKALAPGGLYCQWLQSYELSDETLVAIVATFREAFPHVRAFAATRQDLLLLGSADPIAFDADAAIARAPDRVRRSLATIGLDAPGQLAFLQCWSQPTVDWLAAHAAVLNTDDNLLLEHRTPRDLFLGSQPAWVEAHDERLAASPTLPWTRAVRAGADPTMAVRLMANARYGTGPQYAAMLAGLADLRGGIAALDPALLAGLPPEPAFRPPASLELSRAVEGIVAARDWPQLERFVARERATLAFRALLSEEAAAGWSGLLAAQSSAGGPEATRLLGPLHAELLAAAGRADEARVLLESLLGIAPAGELVLTACRLDPDAGCDSFLALALEKAPSPELEQMRRIRAGIPRPE